MVEARLDSQAVIWAGAKSLKLKTAELAVVLGCTQSVASKKMRGMTPWTFSDIEALNRVLPPERQIIISSVADLIHSDQIMQPLEPVVVPSRAKSPMLEDVGVLPPGYAVRRDGSVFGRDKGAAELRRVLVLRALLDGVPATVEAMHAVLATELGGTLPDKAVVEDIRIAKRWQRVIEARAAGLRQEDVAREFDKGTSTISKDEAILARHGLISRPEGKSAGKSVSVGIGEISRAKSAQPISPLLVTA